MPPPPRPGGAAEGSDAACVRPAPAPAQTRPSPARIYVATDAGIIAPVPIRQELPRMQTQITNQARQKGLLELVIDEQGRVASLTLRAGVHPLYDPILMGAARDWRYKPATLNGVPVKFRKLVQIAVDR